MVVQRRLDTSPRNNCPHSDVGFCQDCNHHSLNYLGLEKAINQIERHFTEYHEDVDSLNKLKRAAVAAIEYSERLLFLAERKK